MRAPHVFPLVDTDRRERAVFCALAVALVLLRGFVATSYEGFFFDSDQAIVGLMARRLSSFREFPLFYYGLNYLLAVEAWIIAPFFWIARSSVTVMRLPFVALNAITAVSLVTALTGSLRLRPALAFVAALPFVIPTPAAANHLLELAGACVEPFVYVLILWKLRRRPLAFGAVLAVAYLHREFAIFALPALVLMLVRIVVARGRAAPHSCADGSFHSDSKFGLYLACVGAFTACAYPLSCNTGPGALPLFRYLLLALLLPIGIAADFFQRERSALLRRVVASVIVLWAAANLFDNVRVVRAAVADPPGSEHRVLVDHLLDQRIRYARAIYWDAYVVDFLSRERVITASVDLIRIPEYQKEVDEHAAAAVMLERLPCKGRERVASWCIQRP